MLSHCCKKAARCWGLAVALLVARPVIGNCGCFTEIETKLVEGLTKGAGFQSQPGVSRNASGTKLFLIGLASDNSTLVEIVSEQDVVFKHFGARRLVIDDNGEVVACVTNVQSSLSERGVVKGLAFATGDMVPIVFTNAFPAIFEFSVGGEYFFLDEPPIPEALLPGWASARQPVPFLTPGATNMGKYVPRWQAVFRATSPAKPLFRLPNDFYARSIFMRKNQIVVSGFKFTFGQGSKPGRPAKQVWVVLK